MLLAEIVWNDRMVAVAGPFAFLAVGAIAFYWYKSVKVRSENELKQTMIERGMSADDIERVMAAGKAQEAEE